MDRDIRLQRLIDIKAQADRTSNWFLTIAMFFLLPAIISIWFGYKALALYLGIPGIVVSAIAFFVIIKFAQVKEQINREYGKPEENIDFK